MVIRGFLVTFRHMNGGGGSVNEWRFVLMKDPRGAILICAGPVTGAQGPLVLCTGMGFGSSGGSVGHEEIRAREPQWRYQATQTENSPSLLSLFSLSVFLSFSLFALFNSHALFPWLYLS